MSKELDEILDTAGRAWHEGINFVEAKQALLAWRDKEVRRTLLLTIRYFKVHREKLTPQEIADLIVDIKETKDE